jgi:hypothetical protein
MLDGTISMYRAIKAVALILMLFSISAVVRAQEATMSESARACDLEFDSNASLVQKARSCAETFVSRNGYTDEPPNDDSSYWALESLERGATWSEIFAGRRGTLEASAMGTDCSTDRCTVLFRVRGEPCRVRAVTLTPALSEMRVEHQEISVGNCEE